MPAIKSAVGLSLRSQVGGVGFFDWVPAFPDKTIIACVRYAHDSGLLQDCYRDDGSVTFVPCVAYRLSGRRHMALRAIGRRARLAEPGG